MTTKGKYSEFDGGWDFCGPTSNTLPAGIYKAERGMNNPVLKHVQLKTDLPIMIPGSVADKISKEVSSFWTLGEKFKNMGVLHKRGFLLYGPPGTGKTSTGIAVARQVVADNGVVLCLAGDNFHNLKEAIQLIREREATRPVLVLLEDLDDICQSGNEEELLSFLDGEDQVNHIAFIATTNSLEKMGDRITNRPCRFDIILEVGMPSLGERVAYLGERLNDKKLATTWADETEGMSLAHLREMVVAVKCMGEAPADVLKRLRVMMSKKNKPSKN